MIGDWLIWYLVLFLLGVIGIPISMRLFRKLSDFGIIFSRVLVLFLWGYIHWILVSLHLYKNDISGVVFSLILVVLLSVFFLRDIKLENVRKKIKEKLHIYLIAELVFFLFFVFMSFFRAMSPEISGTEKPMELAFINGILRSEYFPPQDPWLSGYGISYYYFGYVLISLLTQITGISSNITYNLASASWYGLTALAAYGLLYNLLALYNQQIKEKVNAALWSVLAPIFILIVSNVEGFLELLHAKGLFWAQDPSGNWVSNFWKWLNIKELDQVPSLPFSFKPTRPYGVLWWRASRILNDTNLAKTSTEVIDEFPFFSYLLGDIHPHVLAVPFVLLIIALALNFFTLLFEEKKFFVYEWVKKPEIWVSVLILGGFGFLNTWNLPIYVALFSAVFAYHYYLEYGWNSGLIKQFFINGVIIGLTGIILYLPFYLSFSSQAGGILPSLSYFTRGVTFWLMFLPLLFPIFLWLSTGLIKRFRRTWLSSLWFSWGTIFGLAFVSLFLVLLIFYLPSLMGITTGSLNEMLGKLNTAANSLISLHGAVNLNDLLQSSANVRILNSGTLITLALMLFLIWGKLKKRSKQENIEQDGLQNGEAFVLIMALLGVGLTLFPEFLYLKDQFGTRMNTIFKFYYETWILWGIVAAYATVVVLSKGQLAGRLIKFSFIFLCVVLGLFYPVYISPSRFPQDIKLSDLTLNGTQNRELYQSGEVAAENWLKTAQPGIIAEAIGGSYDPSYARIATHTGLQNILGWVGHEYQWRGGGTEIGSRESDISRLYETPIWDEALEIIQRYQIRYIVLGNIEHVTYGVNEEKFYQNLPIAFQNDSIVIYDSGLFID